MPLPLADLLDIVKVLAPSGVAGLAVKLVLNGTKERSIRIDEKTDRIEQKLDGHVTQTSANFNALSANVNQVSNRVSTLEGRLAK